MRIIKGLIIHISTVTLTPDALDKLAWLSKLALDPDKAEPLRASLSDIVGWVGQLQSAPVGDAGHALRAEWARRPIFANPKTGLPYVSFFYSWDAARKRAGLPDLRVHDLRHSFASFLVNAGRSLYEVQELLGHADIRTTSRYAHLSRERLFEAVESVPVL